MRNPFKEIIRDEKLPTMLKGKVLNDVEYIKLTLEITDLLAIKYPASMSDILRTTGKKKKN